MDDDLFSPQRSPLENVYNEAWHKGLDRIKYDIIRVSNPKTITLRGVNYELPNAVFFIMWDVGQYQRIPFNTTIDIPRFKADLYVKHRKDEIVNFITQKMHDDFIAQRRLKGFPDYTDKSIENKETYESATYPRSNDDAVIAEIYDQLWIGLVNRNVNDAPPPTDAPSTQIDLRAADTKALESLKDKRAPEMNMEVDNSPPVNYQPKTNPSEPIRSNFSSIKEQLNVEEVTK